ncbi:MAG: DUF1203 domain-containing protein [Pseudomonadota bacterium]
MRYRYVPLPTGPVRALQNGGLDAYGQRPERQISDGTVGCRHCLRNIPEGEACLLAAFRPFDSMQPYAETGPLYICAAQCSPAVERAVLPPLLDSSAYILRGYDAEERIIYGTGGVTGVDGVDARLEVLFARTDVAFVDVRSAANNCFQCRVRRA